MRLIAAHLQDAQSRTVVVAVRAAIGLRRHAVYLRGNW
jgi:hypothetical protein